MSAVQKVSPDATGPASLSETSESPLYFSVLSALKLKMACVKTQTMWETEDTPLIYVLYEFKFMDSFSSLPQHTHITLMFF